MKDNPRLLQIFRDLVAIRSVTGDEAAAREIIDYAHHHLVMMGFQVALHQSASYPSIVATTRQTRQPKLILQAHLDVVPGAADLFKLRQENGRLVGRGVFDMKFAAACYLALAEELQPHLADYDFGIMLTTDEEIGGDDGVRYLLKDQAYRSQLCFLPDGADSWHIETAAKGSWEVRAEAHGKTAHGSRPWEGDNAIETLIIFLDKAREIVPIAVKHTDTTLVTTTLAAGNATNQRPDSAQATLDMRFLSESDYKPLHVSLNKLAKQLDITLTTLMQCQPIELDVTLPAVKAWERIVNEVRGQENGDYALSFGSSDARHFSKYGIPSLVTRPDGGGQHGANEWIDEQGFYQFYECLARYIPVMAAIDDKPDKSYNPN